ncbi:TIGR02234 family membrane protein [Nocardia sp. CDC160]|uniref:TIGR02234 family membrane protein n=1 Tax=Nocardia sp. CDC160 TaxID=3112166 RepID=UPI002DB5F3A2|nr:TIGR02234 family membrane protein [Nocardia sp. CDC160]MEC3919910.1 TIGR02234 family membrane protein [Nocardia sp. CDC160]
MSGADPDAVEGPGAQPDLRSAANDSTKPAAAVPDSSPGDAVHPAESAHGVAKASAPDAGSEHGAHENVTAAADSSAAGSADADAARIAERARAADLAETEANTAASAADAGSVRKSRPIAAVALLAVAAALLWVSSRMNWASIEITSDYGLPRHKDLNGGTWFGALTPLALAFLATIAAVFATHGWWRRGVGVVVAVLAAVCAVPAYALLMHRGTGERAARLAELHGGDHAGQVTTSGLPAVVCLAGAVAAFVAGLLLVRQSAQAPRMSGKYDNPANRKLSAAEQVAAHHARVRDAESASQPAAEGQLSGRVLWDALDEGVDPTDDETNHPAAHDDPDNRGQRGNQH